MLTGVGGRVLRGKEANLARPGTGDPGFGPASPGSLAGRVDSAMEGWREALGIRPEAPAQSSPPLLSSSLTSGQVQGQGAYTRWRKIWGPGVH